MTSLFVRGREYQLPVAVDRALGRLRHSFPVYRVILRCLTVSEHFPVDVPLLGHSPPRKNLANDINQFRDKVVVKNRVSEFCGLSMVARVKLPWGGECPTPYLTG